MNLNEFTSLGRPLDPRYPSNIFVLMMSVVGLVVGALLAVNADKDGFEIGYFAVITSLTTFVAWALVRELDPDYPASANLTSIVALAGMVIWQPQPNLIALYLLLVLMRGLIRTVGFPLRFLDMTALVFGAGIIAMTDAWLLGLFVAVGLILDSQLPNPNKIAQAFGGAAILVTLVIAILTQNFNQRLAGDPLTLLLLVVVSAAYLWTIQNSAVPISVGDATQQPLDATRLKAAQLIALVAGWVIVLWTGGEDGLNNLLSLWSGFLAVALFSLYQKNIQPNLS